MGGQDQCGAIIGSEIDYLYCLLQIHVRWIFLCVFAGACCKSVSMVCCVCVLRVSHVYVKLGYFSLFEPCKLCACTSTSTNQQ